MLKSCIILRRHPGFAAFDESARMIAYRRDRLDLVVAVHSHGFRIESLLTRFARTIMDKLKGHHFASNSCNPCKDGQTIPCDVGANAYAKPLRSQVSN